MARYDAAAIVSVRVVAADARTRVCLSSALFVRIISVLVDVVVGVIVRAVAGVVVHAAGATVGNDTGRRPSARCNIIFCQLSFTYSTMHTNDRPSLNPVGELHAAIAGHSIHARLPVHACQGRASPQLGLW